MAPEPLALRCEAEATARHEPLLATASRVRRWLLVEQPGPWGRDAPVDSRLDRGVAERLSARAEEAGVRVVLVRRSARDLGGARRAYLAHTGRRHRWIERLDLDRPADLLDVDLDALRAPEPPGVGVPGPPAVHLVCTNGRHDPCCADRGRPVVRALRDAGTDEVWESSHIGGDRFAANIVILPAGTYYGRVPPERAAALLADHAAGDLDLDHYRGRCCDPPLLQAAEIFLRRRLGERRLDQVVAATASPIVDGSTCTVEVVGAGERYAVTVERWRDEAVQLTCHAERPHRPWRYRLADVRALGST